MEIKFGKITLGFETFVLFNFFVLMFFSFFGTEPPFRARSIESLEAETTNIVNQLVYGYLIITSLIVVIQNPSNTFSFVQKEKYLTFFIIFCLLSSVWSNYSLLSIKRSAQLAGSFITIVNVILIAKYKNIIGVLKIVCTLYLVLTYFSGIMIPEAIDPAFGTWRGLELQKNGLGQAGILIFSLSLFFHTNATKAFELIVNYSISFLAAGAIILSGSSTDTLCLILTLGVLALFYSDKIFRPLRIGRTFSFLIVLFISLFALAVYYFASDLIAVIPGLFGKDTSLTGRDSIWAYLESEIQKRFWFGYGFGTYWILGTGLIENFLYNVGWRVNSAHNGYLEVVLQLGISGIILFGFVIAALFYRIRKIKQEAAFISLIAMLVINYTESLIFQYRGPTTFVFMFTYLVVAYTYFYSENRYFKKF